jgi:predicted O-methyltransferase YrrM
LWGDNSWPASGRASLVPLYAEAEVNDAKISAEEQALTAAAGGVIDDQTPASINDRTFMAVAAEVGRQIFLLVCSRRRAFVVELGTSFGLSAIHIAAALRDNGVRRLITTEQSLSKAARAADHRRQARLSDLVEIGQGDAFHTIRVIDAVDLPLLDGWKPLYLRLLKQLEPALSPACVILADEVISLAENSHPISAMYAMQPAVTYPAKFRCTTASNCPFRQTEYRQQFPGGCHAAA